MVSALIVTWNSAQYLQQCLASVDCQDYRDMEVVVIDNASTDGTRELLRPLESKWHIIYNDRNVGFAAGQNQAIRAAKGDWLLCLNPDLLLAEDFVSRLVEAASEHPEAGSICGKLLRWSPESEPHQTRTIDSTGIFFTRNMRHLDRGAEEADLGQYDRAQYVFGATGAAAMFRRSFVDSVSVEGEFFDEDFFSFREDADLAWRAQVMGWKCLYAPSAVAWHVRRVTPERREQLPLVINWHSIKNRFLMRGKNASGWLCWRLFWPVAWRDLMVFAYAVGRDRRILSAIAYPWKVRDSVRRKRAIIQSRRKVDDRDLIWWFHDTPRAVDADSSTPSVAVAGPPASAANPSTSRGAALKIAIVGTRGVPNRYGGFEQFAEKVSSSFADRGHEVTVYCRKPFTTPEDVYDRRVRRVILPSIHQKHLDTWSNGFISMAHAAFSGYDVVLLCNVGNSPFAWFPRLFGKPVVLNVDGLDREREKWNTLGQAALHVCEWLSVFTPTRVVTDAKIIQDYYRTRYQKDSTLIGYGSDVPPGEHKIEGLDLKPGRYVLYVSRLEPENNPELVLAAWREVRSDWPLVMLGDNRYSDAYLERLKREADERVIFPGAIYGDGYWALQKNAGVFVFACEVGGVHPALIEAMAAENPVLYLDSPENNETAGDAAIRFSKSPDDLAEKLQALLDDSTARQQWAARGALRARRLYRWDAVADQYEKLFEQVLSR